MNISEELQSAASPLLREFNRRIANTALPIYGVRVPYLRAMAKRIVKEGKADEFLEHAPIDYLEERLLYGFVLGMKKETPELFLVGLKKFLPLVENWAICDCCVSTFRIIEKNKEFFLPTVKSLLAEEEPFFCRVGVIILMDFYLEESYLDFIFSEIEKIPSGRYYVDMGIAWLLSVCFVKYKEKTEVFLDNCSLSDFTYNKTLQKIVESNRVTKEEKVIIRSKKRK